MRIQHNIMAMNAYRNYTNNVSAMKANLEKLSSGYKINRAGDDAAGLAISEKMRAQITGLETAQKNAKDGISLVQTAEGALTEVHDMLNRMVELATQSANGTYESTTDRTQLQKEMDQLRSEINRIAESSNFNGIKLLNGEMEADTIETTIDYVGKTGISIIADTKVGSTPSYAGTSTILHKDASVSSLSSFEINLRDVAFKQSSGTEYVTLTITDNSGTANKVHVTVAANTSKNTTELAEDFAAAVKALGGSMKINGVSYTVKVGGAENDRLIFEMSSEDAKNIANEASFNVPGNAGLTVGAGSETNLEGADVVQNGILNGVQGSLSAGTVWASTYSTGDKLAADTDFVDGSGFIIGDTTYIFARSDKTANGDYASNVKVVDLRDLVDASTKTITGNDLKKAQARFTEAAKDNAMFDVSVAADGTVGFYEKQSYNGDVKLNTWDNISSQLQKFSSMETKEITTKVGKGKALTLQIGDTADSYNQLKVSIGDIHTQSLGISQISIADQTSAAEAVDKIKAAINQISDIRGTLGATQNRLDHTINNLSVMTENIQDAESTIRDVDVAEEMMAYTKNNILIQSAQAMLAQANQVPQGVLQLLQ